MSIEKAIERIEGFIDVSLDNDVYDKGFYRGLKIALKVLKEESDD